MQCIINACFVIIVTHCSGSFLQKYLPVIVQCSLGSKMFWNYFHGWNTQQRLAVPALLFYLPWYLSHLKYCPIGTVSQDRKLTHDKNITGKFYKENGTTGYCLQDVVFSWNFLTQVSATSESLSYAVSLWLCKHLYIIGRFCHEKWSLS